ncbi:hypothetical protein PV328_005640 [Microctonus aethiopoides]|uniref:Uncharacterized protein n=1 Tax=Microctonus aethiopoides TaxID=144406 RepID=A0AA39FMD4_9HYME|nr:hypothetical protein PV328_005640 [Microctonus aethiopoides]
MSQGIKRTQKQLCGPINKDVFDHDNHDDDDDDDATIERKSIKRSISSVSSTPRNNYDRRYTPTKTYGSQSKPTLVNFMDRLTNLEEKLADQQQEIIRRLARLEEQGHRIEDELKCMGRNRRPTSRRVGTKPPGLPFDSVEAICSFEEATDEEYDSLVDYCVWLAGSSPGDCASTYYKNIMTDELSDHITWAGARNMTALDGTRLAQAFEDAMSQNPYFRRPNRAEFKEAIIKALNSAKERVRKARAGIMLKKHQISRKYKPVEDSEEDEFLDEELT